MNNEITNKPPFKVKCIIAPSSGTLTEGKEYQVVNVEYQADENYYKVSNNEGNLNWYFAGRFEIVETSVANPKDEHKFSVGDKVVINKISDDYVSLSDGNVKIGDVATVTLIENHGDYDVRLTNPNWNNAWWFSRNDLSLADNSSNCRLLTHQEVIQAVIDGKEVEMQYKDGTWDKVLPMDTTLYQLTLLNFRLKTETSLEDKRKAVIKKLLETKVAVLCKCWDEDESKAEIVAITTVDENFVYLYMSNTGSYKNATAIDDNGNEITNV